jgi:hypothetical protein
VSQEYQIYIPEPSPSCSTTALVDVQLVDAFDMMRYDFISYWVHTDSVTEINYDENGLNPLTKQTLFFYENTAHHQLTRTQTTNSKGEIQTVTTNYPHENASQQVYADMVTNQHKIIQWAGPAANSIDGTENKLFQLGQW